MIFLKPEPRPGPYKLTCSKTSHQARPGRGIFGRLAMSITLALALSLLPAWLSPAEAAALHGFSSVYELKPDFESNIPLIIIEFETPNSLYFDESEVAVQLIDHQGSPNRPSDSPTAAIKTTILITSNDGSHDKESFHLSIPAAETLSFLGLPPGKTLSLLGSDRDQGMLRTYLALLLAGHLDSSQAPAGKYCELIFKHQNRYYYQGLYLLTEEISEGFLTGSSNFKEMAYLDMGPGGARSGGSYFLVHPDGKPVPAPPDSLFIKTEENLKSKSSSVFFKAQSDLDLDSFADAYLLNLVMLNYPPHRMPFYFYQTKGDDLAASARWSFWPALDNSPKAYIIDEDEFDDIYPWYRNLLESSDFISLTRKRFFALDRGPWEVGKVEHAIDELAKFLGPALERDWARWAEAYESNRLENGVYENPLTLEAEVIIRKTSSPTEELIKLKYNFRNNNLAVKDIMEDLRWKKVFFNEEKKTRKNLMLTAGFVIIFFGLVAYVRRRM